MAAMALAVLALVIAGAALGWTAFFRVRKLERQVAELTRAMAPPTAAEVGATPPPEPTGPTEPTEPAEDATKPAPAAVGDKPEALANAGNVRPEPGVPGPLTHWRSQWMVWLGGLCVALAGIFMVRYSVESGLLGPRGRVALGLISGVLLHAVAEWLRRKRGAHPAFAALAGGASITLFAALLAGLHLYHLLDPRLVFALLAAVSLATMALALRHGPLLAAIGLLGAYGVPILVSTGSGNIVAAMVYALIISTAGLLLVRFVYRPWLWWGLVAGILAWWLMATTSGVGDFRGLYLAVACYLLVATPAFDWRLSGPASGAAGAAPLGAGLVLLMAAWGISLHSTGVAGLTLLPWGLLVAVVGLAARERRSLAPLPWLSLVVAWAAIAASQLQRHLDQPGFTLAGLDGEAVATLMAFALQMTALYVGLGALALYRRPFNHGWCALTCLAPLLWLALVYLLSGALSESWRWSLLTLIIGLAYATLSGVRLEKKPGAESVIWLVLASHLAYSLAAAMYFREAGLTLALALQVVTLAGLARRYPLPWLDWLVKGAIALVVARLSFNPWLVAYPTDVHWSLWTGGGSTACCALAAWLLGRGHRLRPWLEAAGLHLLVLTLGAEVRYWLYDGEIFGPHYSLTESAINASLWGALGLSYRYRARFSTQLGGLYQVLAAILLVLAAASYGLSATVLNPLWSQETVAPRPLFNLLLLAYGLPVVLAALASRHYRREARRVAGAIAAGGLLLFVSMEIRHLWQGQLSLELATGSGELYTYSAVWLAMAVAAVVAGIVWRSRHLNSGGQLLLALVIAKIFVVDMAGLEGLLRVASFMGLGLSLLGLAYLRSRLVKGET